MNKTIIIAEAGVNHNGDFEMAKQLVRVAAEAKVDYVKFQTFKAAKIASKESKKADYQSRNIDDGDDSQYSMLKKLEMPDSWHQDLKVFSESLGVKFLSTGFDEESVDFLDRLGVDFFKIPSSEITNRPFLEHIAKKNKPVVISTGMSNMQEVKDVLDVMELSGLNKSKIKILHCNTEYPTPFNDVNLIAMVAMQKELGVEVGYSDHTLGIEVPIAAVALGATIIEKHFTLNRNLPGPDHRASLEPEELKSMVMAIRNIEEAVGGPGIKEPSNSERKNREIGRKSIFYKYDLAAGHVISLEDMVMLRPGDGISPMLIDRLVGKKLNTSVSKLSKATFSHIDNGN